MRLKGLLLALLWAGAAHGATSLDLAHYQVVASYDLPDVAVEASAVTYNWDTGTLFMVGDSGKQIVEVNLQGRLLSTMPMSQFEDTESLTYLGGGAFAIGEERLQNVYRFTYVADNLLKRSRLEEINLGPNAGNDGIEGITYDPSTGALLCVKEKNPERIFQANVNFSLGIVSMSDLFAPELLGVNDLADLQALSTVPAYAGTPLASHLLIQSQASALLLETDRQENVFGRFDFSPFASNAEGVTIDGQGTIYVVSETPRLWVLRNVPEPTCTALALGGLAAASSRRWRRP